MLGGGSLGLLVVLVAVAAVTIVVWRRPVPRWVARLMIVGLWLRVIGSQLYLHLVGMYYGGGDYLGYYRIGEIYSERLLQGDLGPAFGLFAGGFGAHWWGTTFTARLTGLVLAVTGRTLPGASIVFAALGFSGILALAYAFARAFPGANQRWYVVLVMLFPSLWFWPTAIGKDAVVLCGVGVATLGFVGAQARTRWLTMAVGVLLVFAIRPQVAAALAFALAAGQWLSVQRRWTVGTVVRAVALAAVGLAVVSASSGALGVDLFDVEEVEGYLQSKGASSARGGSSIQSASFGALWLAPVNTLLRPFPWEAEGSTAMLASFEVLALWLLVAFRRRPILSFVRAYRWSPLFWTALVFVAVYSLALGLSIGNIGIIARQRIHILPFIFMFVAGGSPADRAARSRSAKPLPARRRAHEPASQR